MNIDYAKGDGLVPVIVQHFTTGEVLMLGYGNTESMQRCRDSGELWLYSRSRGRLWHKGETSGNTQNVMDIDVDCDGDTVLIRVSPNGPMCHTGARSCFQAAPTLVALGDVIEQRKSAEVENSYTAKLMADENLRLKKIGEEGVELVMACKGGDKHKIANEAADLFYHSLVACAAAGVTIEDVLQKLDERGRYSRRS
jgi:phosphoribosyl-AMP cyclohydrolase / phosphoribosyl-ATP pyrophosphohydrolase